VAKIFLLNTYKKKMGKTQTKIIIKIRKNLCKEFYDARMNDAHAFFNVTLMSTNKQHFINFKTSISHPFICGMEEEARKKIWRGN
jgi:hypothetical protein